MLADSAGRVPAGGTGGGGGGDTTAPGVPTNLSGSGSGGVATLNWDDNTESDLAGYNVYRSTSRNGTYSQINGALVTSSSYVDSNVNRRSRYYYKVSAVDTSGNESGLSNRANVRIR